MLKGDPDRAGLYTIMLRIPAHTRIAAHEHMDDRVATAVSGTWYIGYGDSFNSAQLKALPAGSFYAEPSHRSHFAETRDQDVRNELRHTAEFPHLKGAAEGVLHDVFRQRQVVDFTLAVNNIDAARDELIACRSDRSRDSMVPLSTANTVLDDYR